MYRWPKKNRATLDLLIAPGGGAMPEMSYGTTLNAFWKEAH
jgi:hypothetical protein